MKLTKNNISAFAILTAVLTGCATVPYQPYAREVKKRPSQDGVIALKEIHQSEDRAKADSLMLANCAGKKVNVLEEGETVTGTQTQSNAKKTNDKENRGGMQWGAFTIGGQEKDAENTSLNTSTVALKEWQISYRCGDGMDATKTASNAPAPAVKKNVKR